MSEVQSQIEKLKDPKNINGAMLASSAHVLNKAFEMDPTVKKLIEAGDETVKVIRQEMGQEGAGLNEITVACYAYILGKINPEAALDILNPRLRVESGNPNPLVCHFALDAVARAVGLRPKPLGQVYSRPEMMDLLKKIER